MGVPSPVPPTPIPSSWCKCKLRMILDFSPLVPNSWLAYFGDNVSGNALISVPGPGGIPPSVPPGANSLTNPPAAQFPSSFSIGQVQSVINLTTVGYPSTTIINVTEWVPPTTGVPGSIGFVIARPKSLIMNKGGAVVTPNDN